MVRGSNIRKTLAQFLLPKGGLGQFGSVFRSLLHLTSRREDHSYPISLTPKNLEGVSCALRNPERTPRFHEELLSIHLCQGPSGDPEESVLFGRVHIIIRSTARSDLGHVKFVIRAT